MSTRLYVPINELFTNLRFHLDLGKMSNYSGRFETIKVSYTDMKNICNNNIYAAPLGILGALESLTDEVPKIKLSFYHTIRNKGRYEIVKNRSRYKSNISKTLRNFKSLGFFGDF